jgi:predicted nucleic acid-binding protein
MAFVLDASVTACWAFADEDHPDASLAFDRMRAEEGVVPGLWWFEVRNILIVNERRRRITESDTAAFLLSLSRLRIRVDRVPDENGVLRLARAHRLSVYDAAYLELAQREGLPLATLDADLRKAAAGEGVAPVSRDAKAPEKQEMASDEHG